MLQGAKDAPAPRPNKRPRLGPSPAEAAPAASQEPIKGVTAKGKEPAHGQNAQLEEYMQVMQRKKGPSWKDADAIPNSTSTPPVPPKATTKDMSKPFAWVEDEEDGEEDAEDTMDADSDAQNPGVSDMDWLKQRMRTNLEIRESAPEKVFEQSDDEDDAVPAKTAVDEAPLPKEDETTAAILRTGRLFLRNLSFSCAEDELLELFAPFGSVAQVSIRFPYHREGFNLWGTLVSR